MIKIKRKCPFCGGLPIVHSGIGGVTFVLCEKCGAVVSFRGRETYNATVDTYNTRVAERKDNKDD
jgi:transcription elongation factor Elf1